MAGELNLQVTTLRDAVTANAPTPQMMYVLLEAQPTGAQVASASMPLNLVLVLDRSGSMSGARIGNLRQAVKMLIDQLQPSDFISLVLFDDQVEVPLPSQPAANKQQLHAIVDRIDDRGGTQMSLGLQSGLGEAQRNLDPGRVNKIVLLTDGNTWGDEAMCQSLAQQAGQMRVPIVSLGLGLPQPIGAPGLPQPVGGADDWNHALLDGIAQASGGASDLIETPDKIVQVFQSIVKSAQASVVRNTEMLFRLSADVAARNVWQVTPLISNLSQRAISPRDVQVTLGDIEKTVGKSVLVEVTLPVRAPGKMRIAQAEITYDVPAAGLMAQKIKSDILIEFGTESPIKPNVMNLVERVNAHKLQTRALQDAQAGNVAGATQKLKQAATQLLNMGEAELAQQALQEAQNLQQQGQMTSAGTKRLNYGTRKLTQNLPPQTPPSTP
jgi:Ca-activated chloride channel family protein